VNANRAPYAWQLTTGPAFPAGREPADAVAAAAELASAAPTWLRVTGVDNESGGTFTACPPQSLDGTGSSAPGPSAFGGDTLIALGTGPDGSTVTVTVVRQYEERLSAVTAGLEGRGGRG
jgi:hypothetical protein